MSEVRTFFEGTLRWIRYSAGTLGTWTTASGAQGVSSSGAVAFVQVGTRIVSAQDIATIMDRGVPQHHKQGAQQPIDITITYLEGITANNPALFLSGIAGASQSLMTFELKQTVTELAAASALYTQFHGCALIHDNWTDANDGNPKEQQWRALSMLGPTGSGYLG